MIVYLAGPIDFNEGAEVTRIKVEIKAHFKAQDCVWVFDPASAWQAPSDLVPDEFVHWSNLHVLQQADILFAVLVKGVLTVGTILEIEHAVSLEVPVVVIGDLGMNSVGLCALGVSVYESIKEWSENGDLVVPRTDAEWFSPDKGF